MNDIIVIAIEVSLLAAALGLGYVLVRLCVRAFLPARLTCKNSLAARYLRRLGRLLLLLFVLLSAGLIAANGYLIYREESVLATQLALLRSLPQVDGRQVAIAVAQCLMLTLLTSIVLRIWVRGLIRKLGTLAKNIDTIRANDASIDRLFLVLEQLVSTGTWLAIAIVCTRLLQLPSVAEAFATWVLGVYLAIAFGQLLVKALPIVMDTLDDLSLRVAATEGPLRYYRRFRYLIPALKQCLELIIYIGIASLIFRYSAPLAWLSQHANKIMGMVAVYFLARVVIEGVNVTVDEFVRRCQGTTEAQKQRRLTIAPLLKDCLKYLVYLGAIVSVLGIIKIDPTPILAGAGIVGLAVGFGAQNFIEDIVSGFLILFENYYLVGDYIAAGRLEERPVEGVVESIELRTTKLRHPDGQVQIVRNGEIGSVVNYSKQYIYATVDIPFADEANLEAVYPLIDAVGERLKQEHPSVVIEATRVEGLENLGKSLVLVRTQTKVKPGQHLHIQRVLRKLLKDTFDRENIQLTDYEPKLQETPRL